MNSPYSPHYSVLKNECLHFLTDGLLNKKGPFLFADLTFGGGGHTSALLNFSEVIYVTAVDQDPDALGNGSLLIKENNWDKRLELFPMNFEKFPKEVQKREELFNGVFISPFQFDGVLLDLGVSGHHFDKGERGFSFRFDAELDMRMNYKDKSQETAKNIINEYSQEDLETIFREYGEEQFSKRIAQEICSQRTSQSINTTKELENIIFHCYPKKLRHQKTSPATKVFQALRIFVNRELEVLKNVLPELLPLLKIGGKLAVISFHSLEDRIVKQSFKEMEQGEICTQILTKKCIRPTDQEINENSRSRSAKLRVIERTLEKKKKNKYAQ